MNERDEMTPTAATALPSTDVVWIKADGWSVAHAIRGAHTTWAKARWTRCGRRVPGGRDPAGEQRRCRRCETATPMHH